MVFRTKKKGPTANHVGLHRRWALGKSYSRWQLQYELCLRDKKGTIGEQCSVCQRHVQEVGKEWCSLLYQRQIIGQAELEQIHFHVTRVSKVNCNFQQDSPRMSLWRLERVE